MSKPFKLKLSLSSFQLCRSKMSCILTPENPKGVNIINPRSSPAPPPSSPNHPSGKRNDTSKTRPIGFESVESSLCTSVDNLEVQAYLQNSTVQKLHNSPEASMEFDESALPIPSTKAEKNNNKEGRFLKKNPSITMSVSSADSGWFSSEDLDEYDEDSEGHVSSCSSLDDSYDSGHSEDAPNDHTSKNGNGSERNKKDSKVRRLKQYVSNNGNDGEKTKPTTTTTALTMLLGSEVLGGLLPHVVDGKVNESYAVMKKSTDPFDDFKVSMLEMIEEKQISEPEELEKLLICFLSLNAKDHHAAIVAAFTEIWEELHSSSDSQN